jgi:orotidine-5'-phosphate decarboxylase
VVGARRSQIVLGLDPDPSRLWPESVAEAGEREIVGDEAGSDPVVIRTALAVALHCRAAIEAAGSACVAVKLQLACFERLGGPGWAALTEVADAARREGLLVIADGKRGDVPVTARAYAEALLGGTAGPFGALPGLGADAVTLNPLLGRDALEPFVEASAAGAGCFCLVRTSNPGAAEIQDGGEPPLHERLAGMVEELGREAGAGGPLSSVGAVTGATSPQHLSRLRDLMPRAIFLLPGVGAQGGRVEDLGPAFAPHPAGGLVAASRSIVDAHRGRDEPGAAARAAAEELREAAWAVGGGPP